MAEECLPSLISDTLAITRDLSSTVESIESIEVLSTEDPIIQTPDSIAVKRRAKIKQTLPLIIPNNSPSTDVVDSVLNDRIDITATTTTESAVSTKSNAIVSFVKLNLAADGESDLIGKNESPLHQTQNRAVEVISETIFALDSTTIPVTNGNDEEEDDDDVIAEHHRHLLQQRDHEKVGIYLETPVIDESSISIAVNDFEKASGVRPKRLSDDFFSSDDGDDDNKSEPTNASSTLEGETSSTSHLVRLVECEENSHGDMFAVESSFLEEEDTSSSCSNLVNISKGESRFGKRSHQHHHHHNDDDIAMGVANSTNDTIGDVVNNVDETRNDHVSAYHQTSTDTDSVVIPFYDNDVQSMDAIERKDFEHEQSLIGGVIIKSSTLVNSDNKLNLEFLESYKQKSKTRSSSENKVSSGSSHIDNFHNHNSSTPTSSRCATARLTKSTAKLNLSASLDRVSDKQSPDENYQKSIEKVRLVNSSNNTSCSTSNKETTTTLASSSPSSTSTSSTHHNQPQIQLQHQNSHVNSSSNNNNNSSSTITTGTGKNVGVDVFLNSNSNDSLSSDKSYNTSSSHSLPNFFSKTNNSELLYRRGELLTASTAAAAAAAAGTSKCTNTSGDSNFEKTPDLINNTTTTTTNSYGGSSETGLDTASASTSSIHSTKCQYANFCCQESLKYPRIITTNSSNSSSEPLSKISMFASGNTKKIPSTAVRLETSTSSESSKLLRNYDTDTSQPHSSIVSSSSSASTSSTVTATSRLEEHLIEQSQIIVPAEHTEHDFDDDTWADCEEGSDEEVCTCYNEPNEYVQSYIEEELPSRDVDLSGYIQLVTISEDIFLQDHPASDTTTTTITSPTTSTSTTMSQRKRKLNDRLTDSTPDTPSLTYGETTPGGRKRIALDTNRTVTLTPSGVSSPSTFERRTPRSLIPTKDNPPPELSDWLLQFQRWSHAERLLAVDRLIEHCEPTQVRHMMKVIEPQFQRDFISLLPKELALQVLSYLDPKDLLRATQTCRSWRFLCDDNLLWKEKCKQAQIVVEPKTDRPKRGRAGNMPPISSPWKAAYMRQHIIEMNWRSRPIREPKILKGHDDHVITCLQFCGNRIVSGSDDNTLKVWSAISGKCLRTLVGHTGGVWSSQMSGNIIISGSTDRTLKVWNVDTGQCIHTLLGHTSTVRCMHLHGNKVVSGSRDATLRVWDVEQGSCLHVLVGHLAAVRCVQYDGKLIVSGAYDYMVKVWNPERQECLHTLQGHTNRVYSLQFDGIHVVSGSLDTSIRVWDAETGSCKHTLMGHQSLTSGMELRQNILVSGNADSTVKVWDITTGQCLQTLSGPNKHQSAVTCLQFNSRFVITSSDDGTVKLWDVKTGEFIRNLVALDSGGSGGVVWRIRANDTKLICAVGSRNGTEETKLMVLDFDVEGACLKCS